MASAWGSSWGLVWGNSWGAITATIGGGTLRVHRLRKRDDEETEEEYQARLYAGIDAEAGIQAPLVPDAPVVQPAPAAKVSRKTAFVKFDDAPWRELLAHIEQRAAQEFAVNVEDRLALAAGDMAEGLRLRRIEEENAIAAILMAELA